MPRRRKHTGTTTLDYTFEWSEGSDFVPCLPMLQGTLVGITGEFRLPETPALCDYFLAYFDNDILDHIMRQIGIFTRKKKKNNGGRAKRLERYNKSF